jgi:hypothetical protein
LRSTTPKITTASTYSLRKIVTTAETTRMMTSGSANWSRKRVRLLCPLAGVSALGPKTDLRAPASVWLSPWVWLLSRLRSASSPDAACHCWSSKRSMVPSSKAAGRCRVMIPERRPAAHAGVAVASAGARRSRRRAPAHS